MAAPDNVAVSDGQSWNSWAETVGLRGSERDDDTDPETEAAKRESDAMKLRKEDMELFGLCPAWDDFYLVVCEICNQVTKPQAFRNHLEQRHGSNAFSRSDRADPSLLHSSSNKPSSSSSSSSSSSRHNAVSRNPSSSASGGTGSGRPPSSSSADKTRRNHHHHPSLSPVVRVERMLLQGKPLPGERKELPSPQQPPPITPGGAGLLAGPGPGGGSNRKSVGGQQRERKLLLCKDREYDPNKHCGVLIGDSGKPCTRSLTCKTHSLSLRRAVPGRKKNFDDLLMDHRAAKEASLAKASAATRQDISKTPSPSSVSSASPAAAAANAAALAVAVQAKHGVVAHPEGSGSKVSSSNSSHKFSNVATCKVAKTSSPGLSQRPGMAKSNKMNTAVPSSSGGSSSLVNVPAATTSASCSSAPSSTTERRRPDHSNDPHVQHHPKPVAICTFGLRQLGNGLFLLDRRWDCARSALRLALGSERSAQPPPLKKLCVESRLPQVPEVTTEDPLDPYSFSCPAASSTPVENARNSSTSSTGIGNLAASPSPQSVAHHQPSTGCSTTKSVSKATSKQAHRTKVHHHHPVSNGGLSSHSIPAKKKKASGAGTTTVMSTTPITLSAAPISFPFGIGDQMGALSRLQVSGRGTPDGAVLVTGDVLNGQVNSVHSVTISRPTSVGTGLGLATLVGQLQCRTEDGSNKGGKLGGKAGTPPRDARGAVGERTTGGGTTVVKNHHHHMSLAASELSNMKVPHMSSLPNGLLTSAANRSSSELSSNPGARGPKNGSKPPSNKMISADIGGAKPPLGAYQQVFTNQVQAQLVQIQAPGSIKYPILLPNDERRPRAQQLKVPGGSLPT